METLNKNENITLREEKRVLVYLQVDTKEC